MTEVAVVGFAHLTVPEPDGRTDAELLAPVVEEALTSAGVAGAEVDVLCTAGSEFLNGVVGGIMGAFDALPGWPPRTHSHTDGDGAFAMYEAWVRLLAGEGHVALVASFSRPLAEDPFEALRLQIDPYLLGPLGVRPEQLAALQARALLDSGRWREEDFANVVAARRGLPGGDAYLRLPYVASPLRAPDLPSICPGAAALVLATDEVAERCASRPAWIRGMAHRTERHQLGARAELAASPSTRAAAADLGLDASALDVVEVHAPFSYQELLVLDALGATPAEVNPSGGALPADPVMTTGLIRMGTAAAAVLDRGARRAAAHATNGPCLQHNLLCAYEARP